MTRMDDYRLLGRSGLRVSPLSLGTMTFGDAWGWGADEKDSKRIFDAYLDAGGNMVDTANIYTDGQSERYLGEFLRGDVTRSSSRPSMRRRVNLRIPMPAGAAERVFVDPSRRV